MKKEDNIHDVEIGPLESLFPCITSKVLDFFIIFKEFEYDVGEIAENTNLSIKTIRIEMNHLVFCNLINVDLINSKYKFNKNSKLGQYVNKLAFEQASNRINQKLYIHKIRNNRANLTDK